tara:strand:- start:3157 stop:3894 length:738 start_codon:yes stop_codon:yes gene_type:complete
MNFSEIEVVHLDKPFKIKDMPLGNKVYVIDDYLETSIHFWLENMIKTANMWSKSNKVRGDSKTGLPHHELWGAAYYVGQRKDGSLVRGDCTSLQVIPGKYLNRRICTDFGFKWKRFQYMGMNSQTYGQHGTTHSDCDDDNDWNLSFLYYYNTFWNPAWGGDLRLYNSFQWGIEGREEHVRDNQIGSVEFVPNRLLIFDGRIPHGADAPTERARYADRCSIVLRGDEIELVDSEELFNANDRLYNF